MIFGTMGSYIKQRTMFIKFQIKKEQGLLGQKTGDVSAEDVKKQIVSNRVTAIRGKLKAGKELTTEELDFLRENAPDLYKKAVRIQKEREEYEKKLKKAKTKEEADKVHSNAMQGFVQEADAIRKSDLSSGEKIAEMEFLGMRMAAVQDAYNAFRSSDKYHRLPEEKPQNTPSQPSQKHKRKRLHLTA